MCVRLSKSGKSFIVEFRGVEYTYQQGSDRATFADGKKQTRNKDIIRALELLTLAFINARHARCMEHHAPDVRFAWDTYRAIRERFYSVTQRLKTSVDVCKTLEEMHAAGRDVWLQVALANKYLKPEMLEQVKAGKHDNLITEPNGLLYLARYFDCNMEGYELGAEV